ncbi:guanitoxin biosynthesis L-enduracididine beta-hydroxylase GntD [Actinocrispum sp. NPDC049592]|uniref:guanitoxin biosynthesis L-enduracididine beta-hydroxylase GntD n=1 Tax=Actinocrispum sp. NPDC049592 TaxID=3154835 RepID=UPI00342015E4
MPEILTYTMDEQDAATVEDTLTRLSDGWPADDLRQWTLLRRAMTTLPVGLADFLFELRRDECSAVAMIRGLPVDDDVVGPTPAHWSERDVGATVREEIFLLLMAHCLGDVFSWRTLQQGRLVQDVLPIQGEEQQQSGHGTVQLAWHTEDAFHPNRCDYLCLLAIRNHDEVPTTMATIDDVFLEERHQAVLRQPRFLIRPDNEHLRHMAPTSVAAIAQDPPRCAVLFGAPDRPYLRVDPVFMGTVPGDTEAAEALAALIGQLEDSLRPIALHPGDLLIVDNMLAVHGRSEFKARHDGTDRWLKKAIVTRDLRASRHLRHSVASRVLH